MTKEHWTAEENHNYDPAMIILYNPTPGGKKNADGTTSHSLTFPALQITDWVADKEQAAKDVAEALNEHPRLKERVAELEARFDLRAHLARQREFSERTYGAFPGFVNYGHDLPDNSDLDCPHCGGSGHKDDVRPVPPTPADDSKAPDAGGKPLTLTYRNHRGEVSERTITPKRVWFGSTEWHPEPQWLLNAFDNDKGADRDFALKDFGAVVPAQPEPPANLVERARAVLHAWVETPDDVRDQTEVIAAFAAEYAAEEVEKAHVREEAWEWSDHDLRRLAQERDHAVARAETAERELISLTALKDIHAEKRHEADRRAESAEKDRDALLSALGFKPGPIGGDRQVILTDVSGLRPEMAKARRQAAEAESEALTWRYLAEEEREACAKVAEKFTPADHIAYDMRVGYFPRQSHAGAAIAAAIRARKGGGDG